MSSWNRNGRCRVMTKAEIQAQPNSLGSWLTVVPALRAGNWDMCVPSRAAGCIVRYPFQGTKIPFPGLLECGLVLMILAVFGYLRSMELISCTKHGRLAPGHLS